MKEINSSEIFETICFMILNNYVDKIETNKVSIINNYSFEADAIINDKFGRKAVVEVKMYRNFSVNLGLIEKAIEQLRKNSLIFNVNNMVLITSVKLDTYYKQAYEIDYGVNIIDIENLLFLTKELPEIKNKLIELLGIKSDNENDIVGEEYDFHQIFEQREPKRSVYDLKHNSIAPSDGALLFDELKNIRPGKRYFALYENKCTEILKYLFRDSLDGWHQQQRTDDGLNRFDLICRIKSTDGIWSIFNNDFNSRYILFEFKNYNEEITQSQIYTTEKYLFAKALRNVAIVISRVGACKNALKASDGILKESGKVILNISDGGIETMINMKDTGSDPTDYLFDVLDEMLLKLSK
jgi:hypothetical protein